MIIEFNKVTPHPLDGVTHFNTQIWDTTISFDSTLRYCINAASGKGKSTFINLIYGLRQDYKGEILIDGGVIKNIGTNEWSDLRQNKISIIFQDLRLFPELTAIENVNLKFSLSSFIKKDEIDYFFELLKITHITNKQAKFLSYGERQRVAIVRALVQPFELLLMDEPFSHLDEGNAKIAADIIIKECQKRKAGYIVSSLGGESFFEFDKTVNL